MVNVLSSSNSESLLLSQGNQKIVQLADLHFHVYLWLIILEPTMLIIYYFVLKISNVDGVFKDGNNYTIISNPFSNVYTLELFNQDEFHLNGGIFAMR